MSSPKLLKLKATEPIKTLDELLWLCHYFDIEKIEDNTITFSGKVRVKGDWKMAMGKIREK